MARGSLKLGGNSNRVSSKLFGHPSGCEFGSVKYTYGRGCDGSRGSVSRIEISPITPSVANNASPSPISLPLASRALRIPSAESCASSSSPESLCSVRAFAIAASTPKSSLPTDSSAVTGVKIGNSITITSTTATFRESRGCGTPRWSIRTPSDDISPNSVPTPK